MTNQQIGYRRVSTATQNTGRQLDGVELSRVFEDKISGGTTEKRPQLLAMINHVREGDTIHVHSIDRLARNLRDLLHLISDITGKGVSLKFHKEGLLFDGSDSSMQRLQLQIMGAVAEFERSMINERASEGRAIAKAKGVRFGRPFTLGAKEMQQVRQLHADGMTVSKIAIDFDVSRASIYRVLELAGA